jgi:hypothetical protein
MASLKLMFLKIDQKRALEVVSKLRRRRGSAYPAAGYRQGSGAVKGIASTSDPSIAERATGERRNLARVGAKSKRSLAIKHGSST